MRRWTAFFDSRQDFDAIDRSHFDIENSEGEVYAIEIDECLAAIERGSYSIAFFGMTATSLLDERLPGRFIFGEEDLAR